MSAIKLRDFASSASNTLIIRLKDLDDIYSFLEVLHCRPKSRDLLDIITIHITISARLTRYAPITPIVL